MSSRIAITDRIFLDPAALAFSFIRSPGPGGQNVNKVSSAVQLRFDLAGAALPAGLKARAAVLAGSRLTGEGVVVITASSFRSQPLNRDDAIHRLVELLQKAAIVPKPRRPTRPTLASKERRLTGKNRRGAVKSLRQSRLASD